MVLLGVQKVELVGGESWLEHNSVAIAAISAAILAALVAVSNRRAQLRHDRELRNREHVRDGMDTAIVVANEVRTATDKFVIAVTMFEDRRGSLRPTEQEARQAPLNDEREKVLTLLQDMRAARSRLEIRLEESDPVLETYRSTLGGFLDVFGEVHVGIDQNRPARTREGDAEREEEVRTHFLSFQDACRKWFADGPRRRLFGGMALRGRRKNAAN
jgi:hypothetical protein